MGGRVVYTPKSNVDRGKLGDYFMSNCFADLEITYLTSPLKVVQNGRSPSVFGSSHSHKITCCALLTYHRADNEADSAHEADLLM